MAPKPLLAALCLCSIALSDEARCQEPKKRFRLHTKNFQVSVFPGISTNGIESGFYVNKFSINIFGGLSAGNEILEVGLITNSNLRSSTGIQIGGLGNIVGANAFVNLTLSEERAMVNGEDYEVNFQGIQLAGFLNYVLNNGKGIQVSGALNVVGENFSGVQIAGIGNSAGKSSQGFHLAGIYNVADESVAGVQIASLFNFTNEELSGTQIALINKSRWMMGKHSTPETVRRGLQIGLINFSKEMHGTQIGLVNFGGEMRGKQFGLLNFFNRLKSKEYADAGTPVGLFNLGSAGSVIRVYANELFVANLEYTTGNCQNCTWTPAGPIGMPYTGSNKIHNQNALILGVDPFRETWGFGWGFMKVLTNKASMHPLDKRNAKRRIFYGLQFLHLNKTTDIDRDFNLVTRLHLDWGRKFRSLYWFAGLSVNYFLFVEGDGDRYNVNSIRILSGNVFGLRSAIWPGYSFGIQL